MLVHFAHTLAFVTQTMSKFGSQPNLTASRWDQPPVERGGYQNVYDYAWGYVLHTPGPDERPTPRGLGKGISWGFEPSFCEAILPTIREHSPAYAPVWKVAAMSAAEGSKPFYSGRLAPVLF